jgi:S-disulfanyl-L-cysteine oxidoreductase SoxD
MSMPEAIRPARRHESAARSGLPLLVGAALLLAGVQPAPGFAAEAAGSPAARWLPPGSAPALGQDATPDARAAMLIYPDGTGLPAGRGLAAEGGALYQAQCASCHGPHGEGKTAPELVGGAGPLSNPEADKTIASYWPYATTLFDYVRRAMPITAPQSLTNDEAYALAAYLLSVDGIVAKDARLDAASLPGVRMPNRAGFVSWEPKERPKAGR